MSHIDSPIQCNMILFCRCWIPECEPTMSSNFTTGWLEYAIPHKNGRPEPCIRYQAIATAGDYDYPTCRPQHFNRSKVIPCEELIIKDEQRHMYQVRSFFFFINSHMNSTTKCEEMIIPVLSVMEKSSTQVESCNKNGHLKNKYFEWSHLTKFETL